MPELDFRKLPKNKKKKKQRFLPENKIKKPGQEVDPLAFYNKGSQRYIGDLSNRMPAHMDYKQEADNAEMNKFQKTNNMYKKGKSDEIQKVGEIKLSTGTMEIGYDIKQKKMVFSISYDDPTNEWVVESSASKEWLNEGQMAMSNDKSFFDDAVGMKLDIAKDSIRTREQFEKLSEKFGNSTKVDGVLPFLQVSQEKDKIDELKDVRASEGNGKDMQDAMSAVQNLIYQKQQRHLSFVQKFDEALKRVKEVEKARSTGLEELMLMIKKQEKHLAYIKSLHKVEAKLGVDYILAMKRKASQRQRAKKYKSELTWIKKHQQSQLNFVNKLNVKSRITAKEGSAREFVLQSKRYHHSTAFMKNLDKKLSRTHERTDTGDDIFWLIKKRHLEEEEETKLQKTEQEESEEDKEKNVQEKKD